MNSKPTAPSGTSRQRETTAAARDRGDDHRGRCSAHGSARRAYHWRRRSKPSRETLDRACGAFQLREQRPVPASAGVIVNEIASDVSVAVTTTSANSERNLPTIPGRNAIGRKTTTSTSVMTIAAGPICVRPLMAASFGASPLS